jgi:hypothetical protein
MRKTIGEEIGGKRSRRECACVCKWYKLACLSVLVCVCRVCVVCVVCVCVGVADRLLPNPMQCTLLHRTTRAYPYALLTLHSGLILFISHASIVLVVVRLSIALFLAAAFMHPLDPCLSLSLVVSRCLSLSLVVSTGYYSY